MPENPSIAAADCRVSLSIFERASGLTQHAPTPQLLPLDKEVGESD